MKHYRVTPGKRLKLRDLDPRDTGDYESEEEAAGRTAQLRTRLDALQERLYAEVQKT